MDKQSFNNLVDMEKDIINHPQEDLSYLSSILNSDLFSKSEIGFLQQALKTIVTSDKISDSKRIDLLENSWKVNYIAKPPTPEEFLTEKWIGPMAKDLYPHAKKTFLKLFDPKTNKNTIMMYCCIGWGKSTILGLMKAYRSLRTILLRNPKQFLHLSESTRLTDTSISFTKATCFDLVLKPMQTVLETAPMFEKCKFERDLTGRPLNDEKKILWCNVAKGNSLMRIGDVYFDVACDPMDLVGRNIISLSATELAFLVEKMPQEKVMRMLNDGIQRVESRFGHNNPNTSILIDTSPNSLECEVDKWILQHQKDDDKFMVNDKKWEVQPWLFPVWEKDNTKIFYLFKGSASAPCKVIKDEEVKNYDSTLLMKCPIDILRNAKDTPSKVLKDWGAYPAPGADEKIFNDVAVIERCFEERLPNIYMYCYADSMLPPQQLLWNQIKNVCFNYVGHNHYKLKRYPNAERFIHIDLAEAHDMASISMLHLEVDRKGRLIFVVDFTLPILPKKGGRINIDSFECLVEDLKNIGGVYIRKVSYDQYQSSSSRQRLDRCGFEVERISVDSSAEPYLEMCNLITQGTLKLGRNIIIKNNLKSLITTTEGHHGHGKSGVLKVDHVLGEWFDFENNNWETSGCGYFGKDGTDSLCGALVLAREYGKANITNIYDEESLQDDCDDIDDSNVEVIDFLNTY